MVRKIIMDPDDSNPFLALAQALWKRGEDGEVIARELAEAFKAIVDEGVGPCQVHTELGRFLPNVY